jgi:hypothetical protein
LSPAPLPSTASIPTAPRLSSDFSGRPALLASRYGRGISGFDTPLN